MKSRNKWIRLGAPVAAAAATGAVAVAFAATSPDGSSHEASRPVGTAGKPREAVPTGVVGNPSDPATWKLPIETYMVTPAEARLISGSRDSLIDKCMAEAGFEQWVSAPDLPEVAGSTLTDWRYGIHDAEAAAKHGYHPDPAQQQAYDEAMSAGAVDKSGADDGALRRCVESVDSKAPIAQPSSLVQSINNGSYKAAERSPGVVKVFAQWSACMKAKGYSYAKPMDANEDPRFGQPNRVTKLEIETAVADVACRDRYQVEKVWFDTEVGLQQKEIAKDRAQLDAVQATNRSAVAKASALAK
ncbi:hypothetical protein ABZ705_34425 [Streptomyces sp. NPDC006984]|uniref:hypothetical protein n=1 Tax=Streptomyces sp. NPDC006984 TaxID=3155463 RepID=UPI0033EFB95F